MKRKRVEKEMPKMTKAHLEVRKKKLLEKFDPDFEIKDWRNNLSSFLPNFTTIWEKSTLDQKVKFVKKARLDHIIRINPTTRNFPKWKELETNYQQSLRDGIRKVIEK